MSDINKIVLRPDIHKAVARRSLHMWGCALFIGIAILAGSAHIANALWSVCPEPETQHLRLS